MRITCITRRQFFKISIAVITLPLYRGCGGSFEGSNNIPVTIPETPVLTNDFTAVTVGTTTIPETSALTVDSTEVTVDSTTITVDAL